MPSAPQPFGRDGDLVALVTLLRNGQRWRDGRLVSSSCPSQEEICTALGWPPPHDPSWAAVPATLCPLCDHQHHGQPCTEYIMRKSSMTRRPAAATSPRRPPLK